ncbi:unnamed protein product [Owenia fusiformis]|uniref:Uncharacterized protein n=1 Tax=Owenia fusiformis TaxID=6347 RepID=A0A8S4PYQ4_OWEFU|nr:unnamed protein product [Owenia fusiformis]
MDAVQLTDDPRKVAETNDSREEVPPPPYNTEEAHGTSPPLPIGQHGSQSYQPGLQQLPQYGQPGAQQGPQYGQLGLQYGKPGPQEPPQYSQQQTFAPPAYPVTNQKAVITTQPIQTGIVVSQNSPPPDYLTWSILTIFCCCCCIGIAACTASIQSRESAQAGDMENAKKKSVTAKTLNIAGFFFGIVASEKVMDTIQLIDDSRKEAEPIDSREEIPPPYGTGGASRTSSTLQQQYGQQGPLSVQPGLLYGQPGAQQGPRYGQPGPRYGQPGAQQGFQYGQAGPQYMYDQPGTQQGPRYGQPGPRYSQPGAQQGFQYGQAGPQYMYDQPAAQQVPQYGQPAAQQVPQYGQPAAQQVPQYGRQAHKQGPGYGQTNQAVITTQPIETEIAVSQNSPPPPDHLVWSILTTFCCCFCLGIAAIVTSIHSRDYAQEGDMDKAREKSTTARNLNITGLVIGIIVYVIAVVLRFAVSGVHYKYYDY